MLRRAVIALLFWAALAAPAQAGRAEAPVAVQIAGFSNPYAVGYEVVLVASSDLPQTRAEGTFTARYPGGEDGGSFFDPLYGVWRSGFVQRFPFTGVRGVRYSLSAEWSLYSGCGSPTDPMSLCRSNCSEKAFSPHVELAVPEIEGRPRLSPSELRLLETLAAVTRDEGAVLRQMTTYVRTRARTGGGPPAATGVVSAALAGRLSGLGAERPDRAFRAPVRVGRIRLPAVTPAGAIPRGAVAALTELQTRRGRELALARALDVALARAQGAARARAGRFERRQMRAAAGFAVALAAEIGRDGPVAARVRRALGAAGTRVLGAQQIDAPAVALARRGLPARVRRGLRAAGLASADLALARAHLLAADPLGDGRPVPVDSISGAAAAGARRGAVGALRSFAAWARRHPTAARPG